MKEELLKLTRDFMVAINEYNLKHSPIQEDAKPTFENFIKWLNSEITTECACKRDTNYKGQCCLACQVTGGCLCDTGGNTVGITTEKI